jgi:UDPglucose 6-dehydrogenase
MNICVVGTGYVGLVTGACFAEFGNTVTCVDKDRSKIDVLNQGKLPIYEPGLEALVRRNVHAERLLFRTELAPAIRDALVVIIAVGTPQGDDGRADLSFVHDVAKTIGENLDSYKVIVTKSTVPAGTGRAVRSIIEQHRKGSHPFSVASNPEFLREGAAIEDFMRPNRVVLGTEDETAAAILRDLYRPLYLIETPIVTTDVVTAELIKYAANAFLATKISFINEMADLCESVGADVHVVARAMGLDRRIGPKFLHPGPGFGGSCFPKDTRAVVTLAEDRGVDLRIVRAVIAVNQARIPRMLEKIANALGGSVRGRTICLLGLTFKPNTDDLRESPALAVLDGLLEQGAALRVFDPAAMDAMARRAGPHVVCGRDEYDAAEGADALVLATEWNQFRSLDLDRLKGLMREPIVVDLRNVYEPEAMRAQGFRYTGVGR